MPDYDFNDQQVLDLVMTTHRPVELQVATPVRVNGQLEIVDGTPKELKLLCAVDHEQWPCAAISKARAFERQQSGPKQKRPQDMTPQELIALRQRQGKI